MDRPNAAFLTPGGLQGAGLFGKTKLGREQPFVQQRYSVRVGRHDRRARIARMQMELETIQAVSPDIQIIVGSIALSIPFFIAAVLFGERINRQRTCAKCGGSGLVKQGKNGFLRRCPEYVYIFQLYLGSENCEIGLTKLYLRPFGARGYRCGGFLPWQSWKRFFTG